MKSTSLNQPDWFQANSIYQVYEKNKKKTPRKKNNSDRPLCQDKCNTMFKITTYKHTFSKLTTIKMCGLHLVYGNHSMRMI